MGNNVQTMKKDIRRATIVPKFLAVLAIALTLSWFFANFQEFSDVSKTGFFLFELNKIGFSLFYLGTNYTFLVLPILLSLIGTLRIKNRPILSGSFILAGGIVHLLNFLASFLPGDNFFLAIPAFFLIIGGLLTLVRNRIVLEKKKNDL